MTAFAIDDLTDDDVAAVVALWARCGLTRPWNDPHADLSRALGTGNSTVLAALDASGRLQGTVMVGIGREIGGAGIKLRDKRGHGRCAGGETARIPGAAPGRPRRRQ